ncbi:MAG: hypothetical protein OJF59_001875 [Cytophagales bacterium]|jgi:hypothetical protein|nr:MAG: hypothetical protein OJF59_001875 [Cytophagales bacterium]
MEKTYPRSLAGLYEVSFVEQKLKPIRMIDTKPTDYALTEMKFGDHTGKAIFENGQEFCFSVKWDGVQNSYSFIYNQFAHGFSTKVDLGEECKYVDVLSLTDIDFEN